MANDGAHPRAVRHLLSGLVAATLLLATACGGGSEPATPSAVTTAVPTAVAATAPAGGTATPGTTTPGPAAPREAAERALYDPTLWRDDVDCSLEFVSSGGGAEFPEAFVSTHFVVDGILGQLCLGEEDPRLAEAWEWLRVVAPAEDLEELLLFAGFDTESSLLAYVEALVADDGNAGFQMTVNLQAAEADAVELALTMAHEFTHVFAAVDGQIDFNGDEASCTTYFDGDGCYTEDSYIARWTDLFWDDWIEDVDPIYQDDGSATARCEVDASFLGSYAATNPEEDFAETFSAWVYSVPVDSPGLEAKYAFLDAEPELARYRERVLSSGFDALPNIFEGCG